MQTLLFGDSYDFGVKSLICLSDAFEVSEQQRLLVNFVQTCLSNCCLYMRKRLFAYAKTKMQISFAVTAKLISAFVFTTWIVQSLFYLHPKFLALSHLLWLYSLVCVGPGRKSRRPVFSQRGSYVIGTIYSHDMHIGSDVDKMHAYQRIK